MEKGLKKELIVGAALVALLVLLVNPFPMYMPSTWEMVLVAAAAVAFAIFAGFIWHERGGDERDELHRLAAGRVGFLAGAALLVIGIIVQSLAHSLDPWLPATLGVMILGKLIGLVHRQRSS